LGLCGVFIEISIDDYQNKKKTSMTEYDDVAKDVAYVCIPLLVIMALGYIIGRLQVWRAPWLVTVSQLNAFMFFLGVPSLVFKGLAIRDLTTLDWTFLSSFLLLRAFTGLASLAVAVVEARIECAEWSWPSLRRFLLHWIGTTWLNSVIFGIPIMQALYGPQTLTLSVLAAMSSLLFQLPVMLFVFEYRAVHKGDDDREEGDAEMTAIGADNDAVGNDTAARGSSSLASIAKRVALKLALNPPLIGICLGLLYSGLITTLKHKTPLEFHAIPNNLSTYLGNAVLPLASFSVGLFINVIDWQVLRRTWPLTTVYLFAKAIFVPLLMIPILLMLGIDGVEARVAVQIAALPIALASFTLSQTYFNDSTIFSLVIVIGTILILPIALLWEVILDAIDI
jgi:predicted permease